jgi:hypothetical protein
MNAGFASPPGRSGRAGGYGALSEPEGEPSGFKCTAAGIPAFGRATDGLAVSDNPGDLPDGLASRFCVQPCLKNSLLLELVETALSIRYPAPIRGRLAIVTDAGRGSVAVQTEGGHVD